LDAAVMVRESNFLDIRKRGIWLEKI